MSYHLVLDEKYEGWGYKGYHEVLSGHLVGPPEQTAPTAIVAKLSEICITELRLTPAVPIRIQIWADWSPVVVTDYRIKVYAYASDVTSESSIRSAGLQWAVPWQAWVIAVSVAVAVIGLAFIVWTVSKGGSFFGIPSWVWILGGGVAILYVVRRSRILSNAPIPGRRLL